MTIDEYVAELESQVDPEFVNKVKDWPADTKLYMYLHNIQLGYMAKFFEEIKKVK